MKKNTKLTIIYNTEDDGRGGGALWPKPLQDLNYEVFKIKIIDITRELNAETKVYEGDPHVRLECFYTVENYGYSVTKLSMGSHSGTHLDAPSHVLSGARTTKDIPLNELVGECLVVDQKDFKVPSGTRKILLKGSQDAPGKLTEKSARKLVDAGVRLIGTDALSIGGDEVHQILLSEGVVVLESLYLDKVQAGEYFLCALPLKIDTDGSPIRACLIENKGEE